MNVMPILIRREFWEHRALWIAPLVVAGLLLASSFFGDPIPDHIQFEASGGRLEPFTPEEGQAVLAISHLVLTLPQILVMLIVLVFYLLDSLYAERKDRSILFWKSLPVSDTVTVLSKLAVALVVVPLGVWLLTLVTNLLITGVLAARFGTAGSGGLVPWDMLVWLKLQGMMLLAVILSALWYAPVAGYLLLVSAWARRNVILWAALPPGLAAVLERITFGTDYIGSFVGYRLTGMWKELELHVDDRIEFSAHGVLDSLEVASFFTSPHVWFGLLAAAALVYGAIRIRRHRDDT